MQDEKVLELSQKARRKLRLLKKKQKKTKKNCSANLLKYLIKNKKNLFYLVLFRYLSDNLSNKSIIRKVLSIQHISLE